MVTALLGLSHRRGERTYTSQMVPSPHTPRARRAATAKGRDRRPTVGRRCIYLDIQVYIYPNLDIEPLDCTTAEVIFSTYEPERIGVIDFHGSHRDYQREKLGGINLDIQSSESQLRQHALYNAAQKYKNVKSQMAGHYVRDLLMRESGVEPIDAGPSLIDTLDDLFKTFFPDKTFEGPQARSDGGLDFPVRLSSGAVHDIDDLSSGEKEILYG
jgi:hypothetical protein